MSDNGPWYTALGPQRLKWLFTCLLVCMLSVSVTYYVCRRERRQPATVMIGFPLQAEVTYFDEAPRESVFHHGTNKFVFRNLSLDKAVTIRLPPLAVYLEVQTNNFHKLEDRARWPKFMSKHIVLTLPPNGVHVFEESYESLGSGAPAWCFVFGPGDCVHEPQNEVYVGCVVATGKDRIRGDTNRY